MQLSKLSTSGLVVALAVLAGSGGAAAPKSVLAPLLPQVEGVVRQAQPQASFGFYRDILIGQYRTENYVMHQKLPGHKPRFYEELGPVRGGFYLQLELSSRGSGTRTAPPTRQRPWTTVTSYYPLPSGGRTILMTWEAAPGAPPGLAEKVRRIVVAYVSSLS